eukprot:scaffold6063_cov191-Skeletonema_marinoi.AAC.8
MSYKAGIIKASTELKDRTGSSTIAIKKHMQAEMGDKKWLNGIFLKALKDGVASGDFIKVKNSYELSAAAKTAAKKKAAPKKPKAAPKKKAVGVHYCIQTSSPRSATKKPATKKKAAPKKKATAAKASNEPERKRRLGDPRKVTDTDLLSLPIEQMPPVPMLRGSGRMIEAIDHPSIGSTSNLAPGAWDLPLLQLLDSTSTKRSAPIIDFVHSRGRK